VNFQSVIERPDLVSLVKPPSMTIVNTHAAEPKSHIPTTFCA